MFFELWIFSAYLLSFVKLYIYSIIIINDQCWCKTKSLIHNITFYSPLDFVNYHQQLGVWPQGPLHTCFDVSDSLLSKVGVYISTWQFCPTWDILGIAGSIMCSDVGAAKDIKRCRFPLLSQRSFLRSTHQCTWLFWWSSVTLSV